MEKSKINLVIDGLLLFCTAAIVGIGFLIKYVLIPGCRHLEIYGRNVSLFLLGLDRHQWGTIHLVIGLVFLALLILHVALHWSIVVGIYYKLIPNNLTRWITLVILIFVTIFLFSFSYFVKPEVYEQGRGEGRGSRQHYIPGSGRGR